MPLSPWPPEPLPTSPPSARVLWRMQGPTKVVAAALCAHPAGTELRVYFEPETAGDVLETRLTRGDVGGLEERAGELEKVLREKGWSLLKV